MSTVGAPDRPPYSIASENGYWAAGCLAANGTMLTLHFHAAAGGGQQVDVSLQEAITLGIGNSIPTYDILGQVNRRGQGISQAVGAVRNIFRCKDGHVFFLAAAPGTRIEWVRDLLIEHGLGEEFDPKWLNVPKMRDDPVERQRFEDLMHRFFAWFTKWELMDMGFNREKRVSMVSLDTPKDIVNSPQLKARGFFREVEHPELGKSFRYPGPPYPLPTSPATIFRRAPLIGEHNQEVYGQVLGMTTDEMRRLQQETAKGARHLTNQARVPPWPTHSPQRKKEEEMAPKTPLEGIRVIDFGWQAAAPIAGRMLAWGGAEVIRNGITG
ncbi:MAG: hypothetical protein EXR47_04160 [Dehalococcoidia bacterium]|nr:hypothetical protein [Dehalococcoidia bacterium]